MAEAFLQVVLENLNSAIQREVGILWGVEKEMEKLSTKLLMLRDVLEDAEQKQVRDKAVQRWLLKLKDAAYDIDDILDECTTEAFQLHSEGQNSVSIDKVHTSFINSFRPKNVLFRYKIGKRMKEIRERLDEIAAERTMFGLSVMGVERRAEAIESRQTASNLTQSRVYGREEDRERIIECLVKDVSNCDDLSIYPIIGMGGVGKTTLAQLVFNDNRVNVHFEIRIWVCISDNFDVKRVIRAIIQSGGGKDYEVSDLEPLQQRLGEMLNGKKYLLVLDDVWNEHQGKWERLKSLLACGSKGSSIIVTTRVEKVASIMGTLLPHRLSCLSEDDCWSLFKQRAFGNEEEECPNIVAIGKEIVKKCGGVPLAAETLGSLMRFKRGENEWLSIKESEVWNLPQEENSILPALRLSYNNLPFELRPCFSYCAIFPKDSVIAKEDIINLWMANVFLSSNKKLEWEDIGNERWNELYWRSFFQDVKKDFSGNIYFKIHDLLHDLAQSVGMGECCILEAEKSSKVSKGIQIAERIRHASLVSNTYPNTIPEALYKEPLRTLIVPTKASYSFCRNIGGDFSNFDFLRVFTLRAMKVPSSIGKLKHLRYVNLCGDYIRMLPESICSLWNLQTLNIENCRGLRRLPKQMSRLRNLRHLYMTNCISLTELAPKIGQLTCLKDLSLFIVGERRGFHLGELQVLNLRGRLCIKHLERVKNVKDAKEANLVGKKSLRDLSLCWEGDGESELQENAEQILEALEPPPSALISFSIRGYKGSHCPLWMSNQILENVVHIEFSNCKNCSQLPQFWKLPSLKTFIIKGIDCVEYIDNESHGEAMRGFPSLKTLEIYDLPSLKRWSREEGREQLYCLTSLSIEKCPKLGRRFNEGLPSLISNLHALTSLKVADNEEVTSFPDGMLRNLTALEAFDLINFTKLEVLPTDLASLTALKKLHIEKGRELECLPEQGLRGLTSLRYLEIDDCMKFKSLSEGLQNRTALESLQVQHCPELVDLPEQGLRGLTSLRYLEINDCVKFKSLSEGLQHLTALDSLLVLGCPELVDFPEGIKHLNSLRGLSISGKILWRPCGSSEFRAIYSKWVVLPEALQHFPSLQSLEISEYPDLASLPDWLGNLTSLKSLSIHNCSKVASLPASIQSLTNLRTLVIWGDSNPELKRRCKKGRGEDWYKISHIPHLGIHQHCRLRFA